MIDYLLEFSFGWFSWVLFGLWRALPLALIVLLIDACLLRRMAAKYHCWLWAIVGLRILIPQSIETPFSIHGYVDMFGETIASFVEERLPSEAPTYCVADVTPREEHPPVEEAWQVRSGSSADWEKARSVSPVPQEPFDWESFTIGAVLTISISIAACFLLHGLVGSLRFARRLGRSCLCIDSKIIELVSALCGEIGLRRRPALKEMEGLDTPAVFGFLRPTICLPIDMQLDRKEFRWVLAHELGHIRRRDSMLLSVALFARCLCWFNPLAWLVVARLRVWMEIAADEIALKATAGSEPNEYGRLLLRLATIDSSSNRVPSLGLLFTRKSKQLRQRIALLDSAGKKRSWTARISAFSIMLSLAVAGLTEAASEPRRVAPSVRRDSELKLSINGFPPAQTLVQTPWFEAVPANAVRPLSEDDESAQDCSIDLNPVIEKLKSLYPGIRAEDFLRDYLIYPVTAQQKNFPGTIDSGVLNIRLPPKQLCRLESYLNTLERHGPCQITVEVRMIDAESRSCDHIAWGQQMIAVTDRFRDQGAQTTSAGIGPDTRLLADTDLSTLSGFKPRSAHPAMAAVIREPQLTTILKRCTADLQGEYLSCPKVTVFNGQPFQVSDAATRAFVVGVEPARPEQMWPKRTEGHAHGSTELKPTPDEFAVALQPVIDVVSDGCRLDIKTVAKVTGEVELAVNLFESRTINADSEFSLPYKNESEPNVTTGVTVQDPRVEQSCYECRVTLSPSQSLIVAMPSPFPTKDKAKPRARFYTITTQRIEEDMSTWISR